MDVWTAVILYASRGGEHKNVIFVPIGREVTAVYNLRVVEAAIVPASFMCRGVLLIWQIVGQRPTWLEVGTGGGCLDFFSHLL